MEWNIVQVRDTKIIYCKLSFMVVNNVNRVYVTDDCEDVQIQIMRIATGKTNNLKTLYGRCMRHRNVFLCPLGAGGSI